MRGRRGKSEPYAILANTNFRPVRTNDSRSVPRKQALRPHTYTYNISNADTRDLKTKNRNVTYIKNELASPPTPPRPAKMMAWRAKRKTRQLLELKNQGGNDLSPLLPDTQCTCTVNCHSLYEKTRLNPPLSPSQHPSFVYHGSNVRLASSFDSVLRSTTLAYLSRIILPLPSIFAACLLMTFWRDSL